MIGELSDNIYIVKVNPALFDVEAFKARYLAVVQAAAPGMRVLFDLRQLSVCDGRVAADVSVFFKNIRHQSLDKVELVVICVPNAVVQTLVMAFIPTPSPTEVLTKVFSRSRDAMAALRSPI